MSHPSTLDEHPSLKPGSREAAKYNVFGPAFWRDRGIKINYFPSITTILYLGYQYLDIFATY